MARRPGSPTHPAQRAGGLRRGAGPAPAPQNAPAIGGDRATLLVELCDHCTSAQRIADAQGEKLLSYLLSMAIQESQTALRRLTTMEASSVLSE